jgi:hypothetical protein
MSLYLGWYYSNDRFYGVTYDSWAWLTSLAVIILSLLLTRSLQPLVQLVRGAWNDWTRLSFAVYSFILPILTIVFFDVDWGISQLYGLLFDTLLLAAGAVAFMRSRTSWGRVLSLLTGVLILIVKGVIGGWLNRNFWATLSFLSIFMGLLLLPALIGLLRRGVAVVSSR